VENVYKLCYGDCLEIMPTLDSRSIDLILVDPPYGTTACKWDTIIPFDLMWFNIKRLIKPNRAVVIFGSEPFSSLLRISNISEFKYDWYWRKTRPSGFVNAKLKPLKDIETISVFSSGTTANLSKSNMLYNPQNTRDVDIKWKRPRVYKTNNLTNPTRTNHNLERSISTSNYPRQVLDFSNPNKNLLHDTQKPVDLLEYLIKTYTNEGDTVLDFTMGSGSTGVACVNTNRNFIGIEKDENYFNIAKERLNLNCKGLFI